MVAKNNPGQEAGRARNLRIVDFIRQAPRGGRAFRGALAALAVILGSCLSFAANAEQAGTEVTRPSAVILLYHRFGEEAHPSTNTSAEQLTAHIKELASGRYAVLPLADLAGALKASLPIPDRTVAVTVDDAYASVFEVARPLFKKHKIPYAVFVATDHVDNGYPGYMSWDQLRTLRDEGVTIGHHTARHLRMVDASDEDIRAEISRASGRFQAELGFVPRLFAYPYGEYGARVRALVIEAGFDAAFAQFSGAAQAGDDLFTLPRFALNERYGDLDRLRLILDALPMPVGDIEPADPVINVNPPIVSFKPLAAMESLSGLSCYPSHMGAAAPIEAMPEGRRRIVIAEPFPAGRGRINCTAQGKDGRWRWLGIPVYVKSAVAPGSGAPDRTDQND